ncbi:WAT1-related protein [Quillaja saponaria]|uniref:WAT1-related protein n=1 Tax=Quillaja saponaria TaxID=32244 RepID=A0AAD7KPE2_QUISA|nr:WAT1-related protein [Quillaja saponaria]
MSKARYEDVFSSKKKRKKKKNLMQCSIIKHNGRQADQKQKQGTRTMGELGVIVVMLMAEFFEVGVNTLSKAAMKRGMNDFLFVLYSNVFAICVLLPSCFIFHRKGNCPPLTWDILSRFFIIGLLSCSTQMLKFSGIGYSSPTLASAISDLIPAYTFILAIVFRMEKLDLRATSHRAKSIGTILSITGALVITLYKGLPITNVPSLPYMHFNHFLSSSQSNWVFGGLLLAGHGLTLSLMYILQAWIIRDYPAELVVILFRCIFVTILSVPICLIVEKDPKAWRLRLDMELLTIGCSAFFVIFSQSVIHIWALGKKGPVYVSMFKPIGIVIAVALGVTLLGDTLYIGSVVGAAVIAVGILFCDLGESKRRKSGARV